VRLEARIIYPDFLPRKIFTGKSSHGRQSPVESEAEPYLSWELGNADHFRGAPETKRGGVGLHDEDLRAAAEDQPVSGSGQRGNQQQGKQQAFYARPLWTERRRTIVGIELAPVGQGFHDPPAWFRFP
jgi:hypothetical protein